MARLNEEEALELAGKLIKRLDDRAEDIQKFERYYNGVHDLRFATRKYREAFGALFREFADNYCGLVVDSTSERLRVEGFRLPTKKSEEEAEKAAEEAKELAREQELAVLKAAEAAQKASEQQSAAAEAQKEAAQQQKAQAAAAPPKTAPGSAPAAPAAPAAGAPTAARATPAATPSPTEPPPIASFSTNTETSGIGVGLNTGDEDAWKVWQRNNLDLYSDLAHETAIITGHAYVIVGPQDDGSTDEPVITVEHPLEVLTQHAAGNVKEITAAIKRWYDEESKYAYLTLYTPDFIYKFQSMKTTKAAPSSKSIRWEAREGEEPVLKNPLEVVPVVPICNRVKLDGKGRSELIDIIPLQKAVNKVCNDMLVASEFAAFRQRLLTGMEIPEDENGNIIPDFDLKASINRIMVVKDKEVNVHEFAVGDLSQYKTAIEMLRNDIAAISRTPPQYLVGEVVNSSADALKAAESGLVKKVQKRQRFFGEAWEEVMRLAFKLKGDDERAESWGAETIWANPEVMTEAALADSLAKYAILGVPMVALWERLGASQTEIQRWLQLLKEQPAQPQGIPAAWGALVRTGEKDVQE